METVSSTPGASTVTGWKVAYTPAGIVVALTFVALPFVVRTVEPVLRDLSLDAEEAAATLGATRLQTLCEGVRKRCYYICK